ncbi:biotin-dependent carboxyltransferase family protein [Cohaesibacter intestini]|uniref:5-oxoprolinase subunit C family protein n=1 Tax=Cohaesibacter intestini TaxID=2211145 RepID=UPI000DE8F99D|nr:biotin-dependent carboxyltransferase family protein [Cohaesibacter intestini]
MISIAYTVGLSMVQDLGRDRHYRHGVSVGGAMDRLALEMGNALLGNAPGSAGIEATLFPLKITFQEETEVAITGAHCAANLDGRALPPNWAFLARKGQCLSLDRLLSGSFAYITFAGGIDVPDILGSRSTHLRCAFGGLEGRMLRSGDVLPLGPKPADRTALDSIGFGVCEPSLQLPAPVSDVVPNGDTTLLRYLPAAEHDAFDAASLDALVWTKWHITPHSSRAGYRLDGAKLQLKDKLEMRSHGIVPGVIQVPPGGAPIIQTADSQTSGGYPKIGTVIEADMWRLAQTRIGTHVRFVETDYADALQAWKASQHYLSDIRANAKALREVQA